MQWETVIGLEVHAQLSTKSKLFSGGSTTYGAAANTQADLVDLAMPGVLPVLNKCAVEMAIRLGVGTSSTINRHSYFERKNYFYPDLPKGYQISQLQIPVVANGYLDITLDDGSTKRIRINRAHLEEDAGKSLHDVYDGMSGIDLNRAGTPLLEIVSEPDIRSAKEAVAYLKALHSLVRYLEICDGNMQEGSFRCDVNVSVRPVGSKEFGTRTETKNVNSFRYVEKAIQYEVERQIEVIESGGEVIQETRLYNSEKNITRAMRTKEQANDYRYFPDPDLLPVIIDESLIQKVTAELPELPAQKRQRFQSQYQLNEYDANVLTSSRELADYFEAVAKISGHAKLAANWVMGDLAGALNKLNLDITTSPINETALGQLLLRIEDGTISGKIAKTVFEAMLAGEGSADDIIATKDLRQVTDTSSISKLIDEIIAAHPQQLADYRSGKDKLFGFFVGQAMKASGGQINPQQLNDLLKQKLAE